ncbi:MAG: tetratricopeptide repeat protein [Byssovorax sp.]
MSRRTERRALMCAALAALLALSAAEDARAGDSAETVSAREAFRVGSALAKQGQWAEAIAAFERSAKLRPHPVTTYNIGYCERAVGHITRARKLLGEALNGSAEDMLPPDLSAEARAYLAEIDRRLVRAIVTLAPPGAALAVDGRPLEALSTGPGRLRLAAGTRDPGDPEPVAAPSFDLDLDPGVHVFVLAGPGASETTLNRTFAAGETVRLSLQGQGAPPASPAPLRAPSAAPSRPASSPWVTLAFGAGATGVLIGSITGVVALDKRASLVDHCPARDRCAPIFQGDIDTMNRTATVSTVAFGLGLTSIAAGVILVVTGKPSRTGERAAATVAPFLGPRSAGVIGAF